MYTDRIPCAVSPSSTSSSSCFSYFSLRRIFLYFLLLQQIPEKDCANLVRLEYLIDLWHAKDLNRNHKSCKIVMSCTWCTWWTVLPVLDVPPVPFPNCKRVIMLYRNIQILDQLKRHANEGHFCKMNTITSFNDRQWATSYSITN